MRRAERLAEARRHARRLHGRLGVRSADHVRVEAMAEYLGAEICEGTMEGASAQLVSHGDRTVIMLARHVTDPGAQRFSIAHELGHLARIPYPVQTPDQIAIGGPWSRKGPMQSGGEC